MLNDKMRLIALAVVVVITTIPVYSKESEANFLQAIAKTKELVDTGQKEAAQDAFDAIKVDFPTFAGGDLDLFIKGELYYCKDKYTKAVKSYEKLITDYPRSPLHDATLDREFTIAKAYLAGRKKRVLFFLNLKGYAEGVRIMEKITDRVGLDSTLGTEASLAVARNYEERKLFDEAYLKWWRDAGPAADSGRDGLRPAVGQGR